MSLPRIQAAVSYGDGTGSDVEFDASSLTIDKAQLVIPKLRALEAACWMARNFAAELLSVANPEIARKTYAQNRKGTGTGE